SLRRMTAASTGLMRAPAARETHGSFAAGLGAAWPCRSSAGRRAPESFGMSLDLARRALARGGPPPRREPSPLSAGPPRPGARYPDEELTRRTRRPGPPIHRP